MKIKRKRYYHNTEVGFLRMFFLVLAFVALLAYLQVDLRGAVEKYKLEEIFLKIGDFFTSKGDEETSKE